VAQEKKEYEIKINMKLGRIQEAGGQNFTACGGGWPSCGWVGGQGHQKSVKQKTGKGLGSKRSNWGTGELAGKGKSFQSRGGNLYVSLP